MIAALKTKSSKPAGRPARTDSPQTINLRIAAATKAKALRLSRQRGISVSELFADLLAAEPDAFATLDDARHLMARSAAIIEQISQTPTQESPPPLKGQLHAND